jgi:hypothetical protein
MKQRFQPQDEIRSEKKYFPFFSRTITRLSPCILSQVV